MEVGQIVKVKAPINGNVSIGFRYPNSSKGRIALVPRKDYWYIHGITAGEVIVEASNSSESTVVTFNITGNKQVYKKYNKLDAVVSRIYTEKFIYEDAYFRYAPGASCLFFNSTIINPNVKAETPDCTIILYDKNKKKIATYTDSKDNVYRWNVQLLQYKPYCNFSAGLCPSNLGISEKKFSKIKYWRMK